MTPQLCLGTAQFGLAYGITNGAGQVAEVEVAQILASAQHGGIGWLDTAQAYGSAESVLGRNLPTGHSYRLISKLPAQPQSLFTADDVDAWDRAFQAGCLRLGISRLDGLLLHAPADLRKPGGFHLASWLLGLRQRGLVQRVGVSIYSAADLEGINPKLLDLVQLPLSLLDQRLLQDGTITRLRNSGTAIHARSLYLQGLLLTPARLWPRWVNPAWRHHQQRLEALAEDRGCDLIDLALGFAQAQTDLEAVVLGLCSVQELIDLQHAWSSLSPWREGEWRTWAIQDLFMLDPRLWPNS